MYHHLRSHYLPKNQNNPHFDNHLQRNCVSSEQHCSYHAFSPNGKRSQNRKKISAVRVSWHHAHPTGLTSDSVLQEDQRVSIEELISLVNRWRKTLKMKEGVAKAQKYLVTRSIKQKTIFKIINSAKTFNLRLLESRPHFIWFHIRMKIHKLRFRNESLEFAFKCGPTKFDRSVGLIFLQIRKINQNVSGIFSQSKSLTFPISQSELDPKFCDRNFEVSAKTNTFRALHHLLLHYKCPITQIYD